MKKIYFAAPLFNEMELKRNKEYTGLLRSWGYDVFLLEFARFNKYDSHVILQGTTRCHPLDKNGYYSRDFVEYLYGRNAEL